MVKLWFYNLDSIYIPNNSFPAPHPDLGIKSIFQVWHYHSLRFKYCPKFPHSHFRRDFSLKLSVLFQTYFYFHFLVVTYSYFVAFPFQARYASFHPIFHLFQASIDWFQIRSFPWSHISPFTHIRFFFGSKINCVHY